MDENKLWQDNTTFGFYKLNIREEIVGNNYDLSINKYKEIEYEEVVYEKPEVIINKIEALEEDITQGLKELKGMLEV